MKKPTQILALSIGCLAAVSAHADYNLAETPYLFGDWGGARSDLAESGVTLDIYHIFDVYDDFSGASRSGTTHFGRQRVAANFDLEKLLGWESAVFSISGVDQYGNNYNRSRFGVLTNPSSIEGADTTRLANIWFKQALFDGQLSYKVGKLDGVGEFGVQEFGGTFMNDELAYVPNAIFGTGLPFDPAQKLGLVLEYRPADTTDTDGLYLKAGVFDSNDSDAYRDDHNGLDFDWSGPVAYAGEIGYRSSADAKPLFIKLGMHYNTDDFADLSNPGTTVDNNTLVYLSAGKTLYNLDRTGKRYIDASFSYNYAPEDRNTYHHQVTAIVRAIGPFDSRPHDELGIGLIAAFLSDDYSDVSVAAGGPSADAEYTIELAYKAAITPWLVIQPDLQVVIDPAGDDSRDPVWIAGLRTVITF
jgi:porin